jgi:hypothetical protein
MRKKTIRKMIPIAREIAKLSNLASSLSHKLRNLSRRVDSENFTNQQMLKQAIEEIKERNF